MLRRPLGARGNATSVWSPVIKKVEARLSGWKAGNISIGGRVTLINFVLSSLPNYFMSLFQLPITVKNRLEMLFRRFLWGVSASHHKTHWVDWGSI